MQGAPRNRHVKLPSDVSSTYSARRQQASRTQVSQSCARWRLRPWGRDVPPSGSRAVQAPLSAQPGPTAPPRQRSTSTMATVSPVVTPVPPSSPPPSPSRPQPQGSRSRKPCRLAQTRSQCPTNHPTQNLHQTKTQAIRMVRRLRTIRHRSNAIALLPDGWALVAPMRQQIFPPGRDRSAEPGQIFRAAACTLRRGETDAA